MQKGWTEAAKSHAESSIRCKNEMFNYIKLGARFDAIASRVQTAMDTQQTATSMNEISGLLTQIDKTMNLQEISSIMDNFETKCEDMDLKTTFMDQAVNSASAATMPTNQVDSLMSEIADENGLEFQSELADAPLQNTNKAKDTNKDEEDDLAKRLAALGDL